MKSHDFYISNADTDSISFYKKDQSEFTKEEQEKLIQEINEIMPHMIEYEDDGYFSHALIIKAKNYCLLHDGDTDIKYKGSSILDAKKEPALTEMMHKIIQDIMLQDGVGVVAIYHDYVREALDIQDIERWATKKSITEKLLEGNDTAKKKVIDAIGERKVQVGDKIYLYNVIDGQKQQIVKGELVFLKSGKPKMIENNIVRMVEDFDGNYDKFHYVKRVFKTMEIFKNIIDMEKIVNYNLKKNRKYLEIL